MMNLILIVFFIVVNFSQIVEIPCDGVEMPCRQLWNQIPIFIELNNRNFTKYYSFNLKVDKFSLITLNNSLIYFI